MKYLKILSCLLIFIIYHDVDINASNYINPFKNERISIYGIGKIKIGMKLDQAEKVSGIKLLPEGGKLLEYQIADSCYFVYPNGKYEGISFMVSGGIISRVDVDKNKSILTVEGAKIGDTEDRIKNIYKGKVVVEPHPYIAPEGHYLIVTPKEGYKIIFETDKGKVTSYRAGQVPEVEAIEGCE